MILARIEATEVEEVKSVIGNYDKCPVVMDVRVGILSNDQPLHEWSHIGIRFTNDATHMEILKFIVKCQADDFIGIQQNYYILLFE